MAFDWYKKVNGFAEIEVEGYFSERFINLALNRGISIWNIKVLNNGKVNAKVVPKEFKKLKEIAHITRCKVKVIKKKGIPFIAFRYKKRKIFLIFIALAASIIYIYNSYIWHLDIIGDFDIPIEELKTQLEEENVKILARKKDINIDQIKLNMAIKRNDLAWIGIDIKGTKAIVEIVEKVMPENEELDGIPCNIVALKDGVITKIFAKEGTVTVKKDDTVQKGQVLISGAMMSELAPTRYVHADGEVYAKTWYTYKVKVPFLKDVVGKTGNVEKRYQIKIANYEINFLNYGTKFEKYDKITSSNSLKVFNKYILPIQFVETTYEELVLETIKLNTMQAESIAKNEAMTGALKLVPTNAEVISNNVSTKEFDDGIEAEVIIECIENIGTKEKLEG